MNTNTRRFAGLALSLAFLAVPALAQRPSNFAGTFWARSFAYGVNPNVPALTVGIGTTAAGAGTITLNLGNIQTPDNIIFMPLSTVAPITVGTGANAETVTPTAVSCNTPAVYQTCTITATFANVHGVGDNVASGTVGLQEAILYAKASGGGMVEIDAAWTAAGGTTAMITAATAYSSVALDDNRSVTQSYWSMQPTTLTLLAAPAVLSGTTAVFSATPAGTWTNAAQYLCVTYVDALGGEGPCSPTYNATPSANTSLTITSPAASTGAVGWRAYAGAAYATAYLLPITSSVCTLTTLESVVPACAIGSSGLFTTIFTTTTTLKPAPTTPLENVWNVVPQGHTTFGYQPTAQIPVPFQNHYGPFAAVGTITGGQFAVLGTANLPTGYLNYIGRVVRVKGRITTTTTNTATPAVELLLGWVGGTTAGAPVSTCLMKNTSALTGAAQAIPFECTLTVNAVGSTAIGTIMPNGVAWPGLSAGTTAATVAIDTSTAAIGSLGLFAQDTLYVRLSLATAGASAAQLQDLHIETVQ